MNGSDWVQLAQALIWPIVILVLVLVFWKPLRRFAERLTHVTVAGQVFVAETLDASSLVLDSMPMTKSSPESVPRSVELRILKLAVSDPQTALIALSREIELAVRRLAAAGNWLEPMERQPNPLWRRLVQLAQNTGWDVDVLASMLLVSMLMKAGADGDVTLSDKQLRRLVDQGLTILGQVNAYPRESHEVVGSGLPMYEDEALSRPLSGREALILASKTTDGRVVERAFFCSRSGNYRSGMLVGYEWRENPPPDESPGWARDPRSGVPIRVIGWDFAGRDMAELL